MKENNEQKINSIEKESKNRNDMKKDVQKQNITDDENDDYGVCDQEIIRIAR